MKTDTENQKLQAYFCYWKCMAI